MQIEYNKQQLDTLYYCITLIIRKDMSINRAYSRIKEQKVYISRTAFYTLASSMQTLHTLAEANVNEEVIDKVAARLNVLEIWNGYKTWRTLI